MAAIAATPGQLPGEDTTVPSFPAEITISTLRAASSSMTSRYAGSQTPRPPKLALRIRAGVGFAAAPGTDKPPAQRMPARMSPSVPPHLPSTRTGRMKEFQDRPDTPAVLLVSAATMPATRVPCQELAASSQSPYAGLPLSAVFTQS